jgi:uncharacterized protein
LDDLEMLVEKRLKTENGETASGLSLYTLHSSMFRIITPHYRVRHVWELTPERLRKWGLRSLLLDVDCTLTRYRQSEPLPEVAAWIEQLRLEDFRLCLVSNGMGHRIEAFAHRLKLPCVAKAMKPMPWGLWSAVEQIQGEPSQTAIVGDQVFADIMAGRLAGIRTILVDPIHPEEEPWYTRLKRLPERVVLARLSCAGGNCSTPEARI